MFQALVILLILLTVVMIGSIGIINKRVVRNRRRVVHVIRAAIFTTVCYIGFLLVPFDHYNLAVFMDSIYYLAIDWLVVYMMLFAIDYTHVLVPSKTTMRVIGLLAGVDSISFLLNTFTHHMLDLQAVTSDELGMEYWDVQLYPPHFIHRIFVYAMVLYSLTVFCCCLAKAPAIYKSKYGSILVQAVAVVALSMMCTILDTKYDYSVILYASLAISICYLALFASPKKLLEDINSTIVGDSVIGLFAYDNEGNCVGINQMAQELFAGEADIYEIAEKYLSDWEETYKDNSEKVVGAERTMQKGKDTIYIYVTYQKFLDKKGRYIGCCLRFEDRTEVVRQYKEEQYRATHDMLTGLFNRSGFEDEAKRLLSEAEEPYCMVCCNIQDFKLLNELYGADEADKLLRAQADMIRGESDQKSVSARIYADKFCSLLPKSRFNEQLFMDNMNMIMDTSAKGTFRLHYYIGIYDITDMNEPVWTMYDKATMAIDAIRGSYEEFVSYFKPEMLQHILDEKEVLSEFERAVEEKQFSMYLQPQIASDGTIIGAEALARWIHPEKGIINPGLFIPAFEKTGLIHRLDLFMWGSAAKTLEEWKKKGKENISISVNISTKDFYYLDVCEAFRVLARQYDFDIKNLKLEITESALMENVRETMKALERLHAMGYDIEIDDFGSGYSSLGMLKDIEADIIKIDMIFLQETKNTERSKKILKNIISMAKELGMPVITEGVETKEHIDFLTQIGCDMFQGFYFARPMSLKDFERAYF